MDLAFAWGHVCSERGKADVAQDRAEDRKDPERALHASIQNLLSTRVRDRTAAFGSDNRARR
jgi:hypothetical protein